MAEASVFQLRVLGKSPEEIRKGFVDMLLMQEVLAAGARAEGLDRSADVAARSQAALVSVLLAAVREEAGDGSDIAEAELQALYEAQQDRYRGDRAIQLWQIVVETREQAEQIIEELKGDPAFVRDPARRWGELAVRHSLDESTKNRQGNLGFVRPDGTTDRPGERVAPALYAEAEKVADGQLVAEPVRAGEHWVVLQRRAKRERADVRFEVVKDHLRAQLLQQRVEKRLADLKRSLRAQTKVEIHTDRVDLVEVRADRDGDIAAARRPGGLPRQRRPGVASPQPSGPPGQLR